jgi:hypothetical protein
MATTCSMHRSVARATQSALKASSSGAEGSALAAEQRLVATWTAPMAKGLVVERLQKALNAHDIEAFVACFDADYDSKQPAHPDRGFRGREQVRQNWSAIFEGVPDFRSGLVIWARLYVEPVEHHGGGIDAAVRSMTGDD